MTAARIYLAFPAVAGVLFALVAVYMFFGMTRPNAKGPITRADWAMAIGFGAAVLLLHAGYIAAPLALGTSWHRTALWWMLPLAIMITVLVLADCRWIVVGLVRETPGGAPAVVRNGVGLVVMAGLYLLPPVVMWVNRPGTPSAATIP